MKKFIFLSIIVIVSFIFNSCGKTTSYKGNNDTIVHYFYTYNIAEYSVNGEIQSLVDSIKTDTLLEYHNNNGNYQFKWLNGKYIAMKPTDVETFYNYLYDKYNIKSDKDTFPEYHSRKEVNFNSENNFTLLKDNYGLKTLRK